jgi:release factor glutamine methyltransferase
MQKSRILRFIQPSAIILQFKHSAFSIDMATVHERLIEARQKLEGAGLRPADAKLDAEVLARHALGWDRAQLVSAGRDPAPTGFDERFAGYIARRAGREPVAFITGHREFWGLDLEVTPDVLIPRPETELIVEAACGRWPDRGRVRRIVDVGTGSGCLAIALAHEFPSARVIATDISGAALTVAARNARRHVSDRVSLLRANLLDAIGAPVDLIVSNPPYVPAGVQLSPEIIRFEPAVALYSGDDGLTLLAQLIGSVRSHLAAGGVFVVEFGLGQDTQIEALAADAGWREIVIKEDLQGIPRVAVLQC